METVSEMTKAAQFYDHLLGRGDLAFDIGANIGDYTEAMLATGASVVAVEPQREILARLLARLGVNRRLTVRECAVGSMHGQMPMKINHQHPHLSTFSETFITAGDYDPGWWTEERDVDVVTVDELIVQHGMPSYIKIDTEGFEQAVLNGLSSPPKLVSFEVHEWLPEQAGRCFARLEALAGYVYKVVDGDSFEFSTPLPVTAEDILKTLPNWGDVFALRVR